MQTVIGYFSSTAKAQDAKKALEAAGYDDINVIDQSGEGYRGTGSSQPEDDSVGSRIKHFFSGLTDSDDSTHDTYARGVSAGGSIVSVRVEDSQTDNVADLLDSKGASDVDGDNGNGSYGSNAGAGVYDAGDRNYGTGTGTLLADDGTRRQDYANTSETAAAYGSDRAPDAAAGDQVVPVVQEELNVGKRQVRRGNVRVYSHLVSENVSQDINLRDEQVVVNRRAVNRAATDADFAPGDRTVEVTAMGEEPVVQKVARVVEEVVVGKRSTEHVEQVNDSVRHTEVDVERDNQDLADTKRSF